MGAEKANSNKRAITCILLLFFFIGAQPLSSQSSPTSDTLRANVDLILPPESPVFTLLGIQPSSVERPGTPADLRLTILNALSDVGRLPRDFAIEIAPAWVFTGSRITYESFASNQDIGNNILQSLTISAATATTQLADGGSITSAGIGIRFSLLRGSVTEDFNRLIPLMRELNKELHKKMVNVQEDDPVIHGLDSLFYTLSQADQYGLKSLIGKLKQDRIDELKQREVQKIHASRQEKLEMINKLASSTRLRRIGFKMDFAGGLTGQFPEAVVENGKFHKYGVWTLLGHEGQHMSNLFVARFLGDLTVKQSFSIDVGYRFIYMNDDRLGISYEIVWRQFPNTEVKAQWRHAVNIDYAFLKNTIATITLGKDFDPLAKSSLLALINFSFGFGSTRF